MEKQTTPSKKENVHVKEKDSDWWANFVLDCLTGTWVRALPTKTKEILPS